MKKVLKYNKKLTKQTKIHILLLILLCLLQILFITKFQYIFGSNVDWIRQHITFPEYFRNLFYQTGNIFPNFAPQLGAGQNIFYFAYYGLYNPIILLSYLFPLIPMGIYIMISSILVVIGSIILFYFFLRKNDINSTICFITSLFFLFSNSFMFQAHRHIMFVSYMPFLILALMGVIHYIEKKKSIFLILNICFIILTSYYYSIGSLITIILYGLYYFLQKYPNNSWKSIMKKMGIFLCHILLGIILASILLLPIMYIIIHGRNATSLSFNFQLFIPKVNIYNLMYGVYGVGLTSIAWIALLYHIVFLKKKMKIIPILLGIIITIPLFNQLLNGNLYQNGKVFIPFMPLFLLFIAKMINDGEDNEIAWKKFVIFSVLITFILIGFKQENIYIYFYLECLLSLFLIYCYQKKKKYRYLVPMLLLSLISANINHYQDDLVTISEYQALLSNQKKEIMEEMNHHTQSIYRYQDEINKSYALNFSYGSLDYRTTIYSSTSNLNYRNFFYQKFNNNDIYRNYLMLNQTNNLFFFKFMGIRYLLANENIPYGYQKIKEYGNMNLYENKNVYPIGWASSHLLNQKEYEQLSNTEKLEAYLNHIIISGKSQNKNLNFVTQSLSLEKDFVYQSSKNLTYQKLKNGYQIDSNDDGKIILNLKQPITNSALIIHFQMDNVPSCKMGDSIITINQIQNKLTCRSWKYYNDNRTFDYVISSQQELKELVITFSKGNYQISNIEIDEIPYSFFDNIGEISPLQIDFNKTKGDLLEGKIHVLEDGYFIFTIPYDDGFTLLVDGKQTPIEMVNEAFIGFPIAAGNHEISLEFHAPWANLGKIISICGLGIVILLSIYEKKHIN